MTQPFLGLPLAWFSSHYPGWTTSQPHLLPSAPSPQPPLSPPWHRSQQDSANGTWISPPPPHSPLSTALTGRTSRDRTHSLPYPGPPLTGTSVQGSLPHLPTHPQFGSAPYFPDSYRSFRSSPLNCILPPGLSPPHPSSLTERGPALWWDVLDTLHFAPVNNNLTTT